MGTGEMWGADTDALLALGKQFARSGDRLNQIEREVSRLLYGVEWHGHDGEQMRHDWGAQYAPGLHAAAAALQRSSTRLVRDATEQRTASAAGGGGRGHGPGGAGAWGAKSASGLAGGGRAMSWLAAVLDPVPDLLDAYLIGDDFSVLPGVLRMSKAATGMLGGALGIFSIGMGTYDLFANKEYEGEFHVVESVGDGLEILSGVLGVAAVVAGVVPGGQPAVLPLVLAGVAVGGASTAIERGLDIWDGGGREAWHSFTSWTTDSWQSAAAEVDEAWDTAYDSGTAAASGAVDAVSEGVQAVGGAVSGAWKKATGWLS